MFELYTDHNKSKYSSIYKDIVKSVKKIMKSYTSSKLPQLLLLCFLVKFLTGKKNLMNTLIFARWKYLETIKFTNSEINNKSPGNDGLTALFK